MARHIVAKLADFPPGTRKFIELEDLSIGVFNIHGKFYALRNSCPHQSAPLCRGWVCGTLVATTAYDYVYAREDEIIKCPWHGWEFEIATGISVFNPHKVRVRTYEVAVEPEEEDPSIPTYPVAIEDELVVVYA